MEHDFRFISKHSHEVRQTYDVIKSIIEETQKALREKITFQYRFVGSFSRNMITYDLKSNVGYDFDVDLIINDPDCSLSAKRVLAWIQSSLNEIAPGYGYKCPEGSTRVLTIKKVDTRKSRVIHSCDFAIVREWWDDDDCRHIEAVRFDKERNRFLWNEQPDPSFLYERFDWIKEDCSLYQEFRSYYLEKKNKHPAEKSRIVFAWSVNEICQRADYDDEEADDGMDRITRFPPSPWHW